MEESEESEKTEKTEKESPESFIFFESPTVEQRRQRMKTYSWGEILLKEREYLFEAIYNDESLSNKIRYFLVRSLIFFVVYGVVIGQAWSLAQLPSIAGKIPLLFFVLTFISLPLLYAFNIFLGSRLSFGQTVALMAIGNYLIGFALIAFSPMTLLFVLFSGNPIFINILNIVVIMIATGLGLALIWNAIEYFISRNGYEPHLMLLKIWTFLYVFVGLQVFWSLRMLLSMGKLEALDRLETEWNFYEALYLLVKGFLASS